MSLLRADAGDAVHDGEEWPLTGDEIGSFCVVVHKPGIASSFDPCGVGAEPCSVAGTASVGEAVSTVAGFSTTSENVKHNSQSWSVSAV